MIANTDRAETGLMGQGRMWRRRDPSGLWQFAPPKSADHSGRGSVSIIRHAVVGGVQDTRGEWEVHRAKETHQTIAKPMRRPCEAYAKPMRSLCENDAVYALLARYHRALGWLAAPGLERAEGFAHWVGHGRMEEVDANVPAYLINTGNSSVGIYHQRERAASWPAELLRLW